LSNILKSNISLLVEHIKVEHKFELFTCIAGDVKGSEMAKPTFEDDGGGGAKFAMVHEGKL
jgi:hypothetical protein